MPYRPPSWASPPAQAACLQDPATGAEHRLDAAPSTLLGREPPCDIVLPDASLSRQHAAFVWHPDGRLFVIDVASREGVHVNGRRILASKPTHLTGGTTLRLGRLPTQFVVSMSGSGAPAQVRASHLLVKHAGSRRPSSWKEARVTRGAEEAQAMVAAFRQQIAAAPDVPAAFARLASTESHCGSARAGGDLGFFGPGQMQKQFEDVAFALPVGGLSEPFFSDSGCHIVLRTA